MNDAGTRQNKSFIGEWMWLFPIAYLGHIIEEHFAGFNDWIARDWSIESSDAYFLFWNFAALMGMMWGVCLVLRKKSYRWVILGFGMTVLGNGLMHIGVSIWNQSYTPGLATSILFWLPLAVFTIWRAWAVKMNTPSKVAGAIFGVVANIFILLFVFIVPRWFPI